MADGCDISAGVCLAPSIPYRKFTMSARKSRIMYIERKEEGKIYGYAAWPT